MLHATLALARRLDRGEIDFCATVARAGEAGGVDAIDVPGGRGLCGAPGSPFNKVLGLGLEGPVADSDLDALEAFYDERGVPVQIELCPLAGAELSARLSRRGYVLQGFENQLARLLGPDPVPEAGLVEVGAVGAGAEAHWLRVVSEGFAAGDASGAAPADPDTVARLAAVMRPFAHPEIERTLARVQGQPAGGGASYTKNGLLGIFGTATLPSFRRRGIQHALVARALNSALGRADLATATTEAGSTSQRTFERLGFQVAYTRAVLVLPL